MGQRNSNRTTATVTGCDPDRGVFVERVQLRKNTAETACLKGLKHRVELGATLTLAFAGGGGMGSVVWIGEPRTERAGMIGVRWMQASEIASPTSGTSIADPADVWDYVVPA